MLDSREHGESDLIITLFCRDSGRTIAIAKGARKSLRRFVNKLEIFSFLQISLRHHRPGALALLEEAELHTPFLHLRQEIRCYTSASVIREFLLLATRESEADERIYLLLLWSLHQLNKGTDHLRPVMLFLLRFLDYIGYRPELDRCVNCGTREWRGGARLGFSPLSGGVVCGRCNRDAHRSGVRLSSGTRTALVRCQDLDFTSLAEQAIEEENVYEALNILHRYGRQVLDREIVSWPMLRATLHSHRIDWHSQR